MLANAFFLEPINIFLYTWNFLAPLESEEHNTIVKKFYKNYKLYSIWIVPLAFMSLLIAIVITDGKYNAAFYSDNSEMHTLEDVR